MQPYIIPFNNIEPEIDRSAFIAPGVSIIGDVKVGADSNIWYGCVLRGDVHSIKIGARTNIQDGSIIHVTTDFSGTEVGDDVTVGHGAILHACTVEDFGFVGMGATVLDGARVEGFAMLAAGALLTPGKVIPSGQLWAGSPARYMRDLTDKEKEYTRWSAKHYAELGRAHKKAIPY